jgi:zinc transport system substrate-binding protein
MGTVRVAVGAFATALVLAGCSGPADGDARDRPVVVASLYPLAEAAERVGGDLVEVVNLTPPGVEPHDLELAADDLEEIVTADLVLYIGGGFQPAVEDAVAQADGVVVDVLAGLGSEDDALAADPHVWLDPSLFERTVDRIADVLAELAPEDADAFREGAEAFARELRELDAEFREGLSSCRSRTIVVAHEAFGYLAAAYGLRQESIAGISPESEPNPARLAELKSLVEREGVTSIFAEELASPAVAETLAREAGVRVEVLDPIEGLTDERLAAGESYVPVMRRNLETLRSALGCA